MNPINEEQHTQDPSLDAQNLVGLNKSAEISNTSTEIIKKNNMGANDHPESEEIFNIKIDHSEKTEIGDGNIAESKENTAIDTRIIPVSENNSITENISQTTTDEKDVGEEDMKEIENIELQKSSLLKNNLQTSEENDIVENTNKIECDVSESAAEEETDEFENVEDIEIPGEEEVDEIIVPDEAEAEDLTDDIDNEAVISKSMHEDVEGEKQQEEEQEDYQEEEEDGTTSKDSEVEDNEMIDEDTSKSVETVENHEDSCNKSLNDDAKEDNYSKDDEGSIDNLHIEPDLVALEEEAIKNTEGTKSNEANINEDNACQAAYDPLNCTDNKEQGDNESVNENENEDNVVEKNENSSVSQSSENDANEVTNEEEDDEVQFVETRNSPICIESDDDDGNAKSITEPSTSCNNKNVDNSKSSITATTTETAPKNVIATRTSARKSTAKPQQNKTQPINNPTTAPQMQNKSKNFNYLQKSSTFKKRSFTSTSTQRIVDCIELLDSSDEEATSSRNRPTQQLKTPQKRTLLAAKGNYYKNNSNKTTIPVNNSRLPNTFSPQLRQQPKKPAPPPLPPPTPQSNFLNAVQLQPASVTGPNPPAFSALLSNKNVIIPNAFYGNPPNIRLSPELEIERRYARWLENFLNQFCKPQFIATHSCLVFLQRALKYKDFIRIKTLRANMDGHAQSTNNQLNSELLVELRTILLKNSKKITSYGRRFCELTCSAVPGKTVALMAHGISGKVTLQTCNMDLPKTTNSTNSSTSPSSNPGTNTVTRKRQLDEDEDEYTPDKSIFKAPSENGDEDSNEMNDDRKRSLRTKRTKRLDNSFSYNEDDLLAEYEIDDEDDEKLAQMEIQRKIEQKRLEAQKQRQQQVKSFESAFIQAFARSIDGPTTSSKNTKNTSAQRIRLQNTATSTITSIKQYTVNNDAEDLLQATWIENVENDETHIISDDDEPKVHRIYKQQQQKEIEEQQQEQQQELYSPSTKLSNRYIANTSPRYSLRPLKKNQEEVITGDDDYDENDYYQNPIPSNPNAQHWPKNVDSQMYVNGKYRDRCIICNLSCQRLVHHYVNEHRGCEVYNSRLSSLHLKLLKQGRCNVTNISMYKNGQFQYESYCIFCQRESRFMLPYWYQHFAMHTGEYAYRCLGCGMRKPTRSLLTQHQAQGCPEAGGIAQDYAHDPKSCHIEAKICNLCNYVQLHRGNIVKHLHTQHNIKEILPKYIQTIVLLTTPPNYSSTTPQYVLPGHTKRLNNRPSSSSVPNTYIIETDVDNFTCEEILPEEPQQQTNPENHYYNYIPPYMQAAVNSGNFTFEEVETGDDLSFMICGMLDVQMNPDAN